LFLKSGNEYFQTNAFWTAGRGNDTEFWQLKPTLLETFEYNGDQESKAMTQGNIILNLLGDRSLASGGI